MIDSSQHTSTITCIAARRVWHFSAFHYHCKRVDHLHSKYLPTDFVYHSFITYSPTDETYEIPELLVDDAIVKANPARSKNVITSSNLAYGQFRMSRQTEEDGKGDRWNKRKQRYINSEATSVYCSQK